MTIPSEAAVVLDIRAVGRVFETPAGLVRALDDVTFQVSEGEIVAIIGPSGSGKSTLLNILGLLDRPTSGRYLLHGDDVSTLPEAERTRVRATHIGFVFQAFHLIGHKSVLANVVLPLMYNGESRGKRRARAEVALREMGLGHRLDAFPHTLSGGEKQRAAIARATVHRPSLLLCDEPTGNLDSETSAKVMRMLRDLTLRGLAIVVVTHDLAVAEATDRVLRVRDGLLTEVPKDA